MIVDLIYFIIEKRLILVENFHFILIIDTFAAITTSFL